MTDTNHTSRRGFLAHAAAMLTTSAWWDTPTAPRGDGRPLPGRRPDGMRRDDRDNVVRLRARIGPPRRIDAPGERPLGLARERDGMLYVPDTVPASTPKQLLVLLHHDGGSGASWIRLARARADRMGAVLVAPDSRRRGWDVGPSSIDADVQHIDRAIAEASRSARIDPAHVSIGGFAMGASLALTIGLANGDLFASVLAFSPGFYAETEPVGRPRVFLSHGTSDPVHPLLFSARPLADGLRRQGYDVTAREFEGGHELPPHVLDQAVDWLRGEGSPGARP